MSISVSTSIPQIQTPHTHGHHGVKPAQTSSTQAGSTSTAQSASTQSLEQLAREGDPLAIAQLKQLEGGQSPAAASQIQQALDQQPGGAEPGKGEQVDQYA